MKKNTYEDMGFPASENTNYSKTMPNQHLLWKTQRKNPYNENGITICYAEMEYFEDESKDVFHHEGEFESRHSIPDISRWIKSKNVSYSLDHYEEVFGDASRYEEGNVEKCKVDFKRPDFERGNVLCPHDKEISKFKSYTAALS